MRLHSGKTRLPAQGPAAKVRPASHGVGPLRRGPAGRYPPVVACFWIFAQVSRRVTVRLNTGRPGFVSGSAQK